MEIGPFDIPLVRQEPGSNDCLRCCALMTFKYFGDKIKKPELWKKLHVYKKHSGLFGSYFTDLGALALRRNYKAVIGHYDWRWWDQWTVDASKRGKKALITALSKLRKEKDSWPDKKTVDKEIRYVRSGGKFKIQIPKLTTIDSFLFKKIPVFLAVQTEDFYKRPKRDTTHIILIIGKKANKYIIREPLYATSEIAEDELVYAWSRAGGWYIALEAKEPKIDIVQDKLI